MRCSCFDSLSYQAHQITSLSIDCGLLADLPPKHIIKLAWNMRFFLRFSGLHDIHWCRSLRKFSLRGSGDWWDSGGPCHLVGWIIWEILVHHKVWQNYGASLTKPHLFQIHANNNPIRCSLIASFKGLIRRSTKTIFSQKHKGPCVLNGQMKRISSCCLLLTLPAIDLANLSTACTLRFQSGCWLLNLAFHEWKFPPIYSLRAASRRTHS